MVQSPATVPPVNVSLTSDDPVAPAGNSGRIVKTALRRRAEMATIRTNFKQAAFKNKSYLSPTR
jgi:hypothetical protein